jgi:branched-chain amino acid transport system substrate-binding protein
MRIADSSHNGKEKVSSMIVKRHKRAVLALAVAGAFAVAALAAPWGASGATKTPIPIGQVYTAGSPILNELGPLGALRAGVRAINSSGGINGHPLVIDSCNDQGDPNESASCAREMVSDHVVATFGDISAGNADAIATIVNAAKIPQINISAASNLQYTCATCFPIGTGSIGYPAGVMAAIKKAGGTSVYIVGVSLTGLTQVTQVYGPKAAQAAGLTVSGTELEPPGLPDWSPIAAQIQASGAQYVFTFLLGPDGISLVKALQAIGFKGKIAVISSYNAAELSELGTASNGQVISWSPNPPLTAAHTLPGVGKFIEQLAKDEAAGDSDAAQANIDLISGPNWAALYAFAGLAKKLKTVTAATVLAALKAQKKPLNMQDFVGGGWTPGAASGAPFPLGKAGPLTGYNLVLKNNTWVLNGGSQSIKSVLAVMLG